MTIALTKTPKSLGTVFSPAFTSIDTIEANTALKMAYTSHFLSVEPLIFSLPAIKMVPTNIKIVDKISIVIVIGSPPLVVTSKKKIKNNRLVKTKLDLSNGATLLKVLSCNAL